MRLLDEHGDAIEADLADRNIDLCDLYRGTLSLRRLAVIVHELPATSRTVTAINGGQPQWTPTDHLLADLWVLLVRANSEKGSLPEDYDHPVRAEMTARDRAERKRALKDEFKECKYGS